MFPVRWWWRRRWRGLKGGGVRETQVIGGEGGEGVAVGGGDGRRWRFREPFIFTSGKKKKKQLDLSITCSHSVARGCGVH